jgi:type IV pilus assembly protein PilP
VRHLFSQILPGALCLLLALAACGGSGAPPPAAAPTVARKKAAPEPVVDTSQTVDYSYNPIGKRDPFKSQADSSTANPDANTDSVICPDPLCQFDIDELVVVAVVSGDANPMAMLEDRAGVGHIVYRNSKVGRQGGKVSQILRDCIVVTSFISGPDGKAQPNKSNMCVRPDVRNAPVLDLFDGKLRQ